MLLFTLSIGLQIPAAQAQTTPDMSQYTTTNLTAAAGNQDESKKMLEGLLGKSFVDAPLVSSINTPSTILGDIFFVINSCVWMMLVGSIGWSCVMVIADSAKTGKVLGEKLSGLWAPIRGVLAIITGLPAWGGFSLSQAIVIFIATLGIGMTNLVMQQAITDESGVMQFVPSYSSSSAAPNLMSDLHAATQGAFALELCADALNYGAGKLSAGLPHADIQMQKIVAPNSMTRWDFGQCGYIQLQNRSNPNAASAAMADGLESVNSAFGFRVNSVNYDAIAQAVHKSADMTTDSLVRNTAALADSVYGQVSDYLYSNPTAQTAMEQGPQFVQATFDALNDIEQTATAQLSSGIVGATDNNVSGLNDEVMSDLEKGGWIKLGLLYSTFQQQSTAVNDAQHAFQISFNPNFASIQNSPYFQDIARFWQTANTDAPGGQIAQQKDDWLEKFLGYIGLGKNAMGDRSLGQSITTAIVQGVASNSGGNGIVNPVVAAKNLGDYLMTMGTTVLSIEPIGAVAGVIGGEYGKAVSLAVSHVMDTPMGAMAKTVAWVFLALGMFLSLYIPSIMWLAWIAALLEWLIVILEAFMFAPISSLMLADLRQEGLMAGASSKYIHYCLNVFLRPAFMVVAFFAASALQSIVGTFFINNFGAFIAGVQGNSVTGLASILGLVVIAGVVLFGLVHTCANLMTEMPARLLGWVGAGVDKTVNFFNGHHAGNTLRGMSGGGAGGAAKAEATEGGGGLSAKAAATGKAAASVAKTII